MASYSNLVYTFYKDSKTAIWSFQARIEPELFKFEVESCGQLGNVFGTLTWLNLTCGQGSPSYLPFPLP
jgi:hypothetical protein